MGVQWARASVIKCGVQTEWLCTNTSDCGSTPSAILSHSSPIFEWRSAQNCCSPSAFAFFGFCFIVCFRAYQMRVCTNHRTSACVQPLSVLTSVNKLWFVWSGIFIFTHDGHSIGTFFFFIQSITSLPLPLSSIGPRNRNKQYFFTELSIFCWTNYGWRRHYDDGINYMDGNRFDICTKIFLLLQLILV